MHLTAREFSIYLAALTGATSRNVGDESETGHAHRTHDEAERSVREWRLRQKVATAKKRGRR